MFALTRRRDRNLPQECWRIYCGDVHVGTIAQCVGNPGAAPKWQWRCGFYAGNRPGECTSGTAGDFHEARAAFEAAWQKLLPELTRTDFEEYRRELARTAWKYTMWHAGCNMPAQLPNGRSRCFCGVEIDIAGTDSHVYAAHMGA